MCKFFIKKITHVKTAEVKNLPLEKVPTKLNQHSTVSHIGCINVFIHKNRDIASSKNSKTQKPIIAM